MLKTYTFIGPCVSFICGHQRRIQHRRTGRLNKILRLFLVNIDCIRRNNLIVVNIQCLQYVFYSLLSLRKDRICMWRGIKTIARPKILPRPDRAPHPPAPVLKFLDPPLDMTNIGPKDVSLCRPAPPLLFNDPHKQPQKSSQRCIAHWWIKSSSFSQIRTSVYKNSAPMYKQRRIQDRPPPPPFFWGGGGFCKFCR